VIEYSRSSPWPQTATAWIADSRLLDYRASIPALFFALITHFKPSNVSGFATILQDALSVRRVTLLNYWASVSADSTLEMPSYTEDIAMEYVRQTKNHGQPALLSFPSNPDTPFRAVFSGCKRARIARTKAPAIPNQGHRVWSTLQANPFWAPPPRCLSLQRGYTTTRTKPVGGILSAVYCGAITAIHDSSNHLASEQK
jgi:hypothetical protein